METLNISNRISRNFRVLSSNEKKIADYILKNIDFVAKSSITNLSKMIGTSNAAISRFCTKLDYQSFSELKTMLRHEQSYEIAPSSPSQIVSYYNQILQSSSELIESSSLAAFVTTIKRAQRVLICGIGNSGLSAQEFKNELCRMGISADAVIDPHQMLMSASLLSEEDFMIVISNSGATEAVIRACKKAKENKATVFALTIQDHTALTKICDGILFTSSIVSIADNRFINSQLSIHFMLDVIYYTLLENPLYRRNRDTTLAALKTIQ